MAENRDPSGQPQDSYRTDARLSEVRARAHLDSQQRRAAQETAARGSNARAAIRDRNSAAGSPTGRGKR